jgi:hypothetical protein
MDDLEALLVPHAGRPTTAAELLQILAQAGPDPAARLEVARENGWLIEYSDGSIIVALGPGFPRAGRTDLPVHERQISARSLAMLHEGIEAARRGEVHPLPAAMIAELAALAEEDPPEAAPLPHLPIRMRQPRQHMAPPPLRAEPMSADDLATLATALAAALPPPAPAGSVPAPLPAASRPHCSGCYTDRACTDTTCPAWPLRVAAGVTPLPAIDVRAPTPDEVAALRAHAEQATWPAGTGVPTDEQMRRPIHLAPWPAPAAPPTQEELAPLGLDDASLDDAWKGVEDQLRAEGIDPDEMAARAGRAIDAWHDHPSRLEDGLPLPADEVGEEPGAGAATKGSPEDCAKGRR